MTSLILNPTDTSQWYALVNEAQASTRLILDENTESYLVFLLMRFSQTPHLMDSVMSLNLLESMNTLGKRQLELLRDVGDKSLLFCGLFPGIASKRHVKLDYFSHMGQAAYLTVGELHDSRTAELYFQLSAEFMTLQQILQAMRGQYMPIMNESRGIISPSDLLM